MIGQRCCPFCKVSATRECAHLALACEARDFVKRCVELSHGSGPWNTLCRNRRQQTRWTGSTNLGKEDYTWLETAFCKEFLNDLRWFAGMDFEWRSGPKLEQGGFWILLWSKNPKHLWWELRDKFDHEALATESVASTSEFLQFQNFSSEDPPSGQKRFEI
jgi:hypothetical protein